MSTMSEPDASPSLTPADAPVDPPRRPVVTVVGLGPAGRDLVTAGTLDQIAAHPHRFLRTERHPAAVVVPGARTFDHVYDQSDTMDEVYRRIVDELVEAAEAHGAVLYAVPGSPVVAERTVELLLADDRVDVVVHPALSFLDVTWARLGVDPVANGARLIDGHRFEVEAAGERGPLLVAQCDTPHVLSDVKLAIADALDARSQLGSGFARRAEALPTGVLPDDLRITVVQRLGLPDERVFDVAWDELDRSVEPDHLTSLWIPEYAAPVAMEVQRFAELVGTLRRECPWDREQTHESLRRHLIEEAYEVLDALDHLPSQDDDDWAAVAAGYDHLQEELGDLLFQILFHATLAAEAGQFTLADVARGVHDKLYSRHPHVFGAVDANSADQVAANWEDIKKAEKGRESVFDGIPDALPALIYALKVQKKAEALERGSTVDGGRAGLAGLAGASHTRADDAAAVSELAARAVSAPDAGIVGELLFAAVDLARRADVDPETALRSVTMAYRDEIKRVEADS